MSPLSDGARASTSIHSLEAFARTVRRGAVVLTLLATSAPVWAQGVTGAVAYWPFDDLSDPTADVIGGHDGSIVGATFVDDVAPVQGSLHALEFNGVGAHVEMASAPDLQFDASTPRTISLWVNKSAGSVAHILGKRAGCGVQTDGINYQFAETPAGGIEFASEAWGASGILYSGVPIQVNAWTHLAMTYDGISTTKLYVNAVEVLSSASHVLSGVNSAPLIIGSSGDGACLGLSFSGKIDDVWIFDRELSACEIAAVSGIQVGSETYCSPAAPNSFDPQGARLASQFQGCASIAENDLGLAAQGLPPGVLGVFFYGSTQAQLPFGNGTVCIGGAVNRVLPAVVATSSGAASLALDLSQPPFQGGGSGTITPGSVWNFQLWYRDPAGFPTAFNFSDALEITFAP